tara:strand:- start:35 stop:742 length:708 start_codon:yes stop_codon:yes gene_type:complete
MSTYEANRYAFPASAIASGTLADARIPNLATSKITSGTFDDARFAASNITQHVDLTNLNASNLTSGSIPSARVPSGAVTQHVSAVTQQTGSWSPSRNVVRTTVSTQYARYWRVGNHCTVIALFFYSARTSRDTNGSEFRLGSLPFTAANTGNYAGHATVIGEPSSKFRPGAGHIKANTNYITFSIVGSESGDPRVLENSAPGYRGRKITRQSFWDDFYDSNSYEGYFYIHATYQV